MKLNVALNLATRWNALVLVDEADVFMEERSNKELQRNELVSGNYAGLQLNFTLTSYSASSYIGIF